MTKKQVIRTIAFILVLVLVLWRLFNIFSITKHKNFVARKYQEFYQEPKNSIDGIMLGTSVAYRAWNAPYAWSQSGMAIYSMGSDKQPTVFATGIIDEVKKTQDIKFAIIDLHGIRQSVFERIKQNGIRGVTDNLKPSKNRMEMVEKVLTLTENLQATTEKEIDIDTKDLSYYYRFMKYHSRWEEGLNRRDFQAGDPTMKGIVESKCFVRGGREIEEPLTDEIGELTDLQKGVMEEIIAYGKESDVELIFISTPSLMPVDRQKEINAAFAMAEEAGYDCINMNTEEMFKELNFNPAVDLRDKTHVNLDGSEKVTGFLVSYIQEKYDIPDKRGNSKYASWDEAWKRYQEFYAAGVVENVYEGEEDSD